MLSGKLFQLIFDLDRPEHLLNEVDWTLVSKCFCRKGAVRWLPPNWPELLFTWVFGAPLLIVFFHLAI
jgi:hypothetical protein